MVGFTVMAGPTQPQLIAADVLKAHGAGLYGCMIAVAGDRSVARAAYAAICRRLADELPRYRGRSSLRAWFYGLGLSELRERRRQKPRFEGAVLPLKVEPLYPAGVRGTVAAVRAGLSPEDLQLLVLRVDRGFDWREIAYAELGEDASDLAVAAQIRSSRARLSAICARIERTVARSRLNANR